MNRLGTENSDICRLEPADILLVHTKRSLWASIVRFGTHCYWNHAAMVCRAPHEGRAYEGALVVDAKTDGGLVIRPVAHYIDHPEKYDVAVKRMDSGWARLRPDAVRGLRSRICNAAVDEVDIKLGLPLVEHIDKLLRQSTVILRFIRRKIRRAYRPPPLPWNIRPIEVRAFTCAGFVQWCYYKAALKAANGADHALMDHIVFNPRARTKVTPFELLTTTPADLAECDKLSWKYRRASRPLSGWTPTSAAFG